MIRNRMILLIAVTALFLGSCGNDDGGNAVVIPPRPLAEVEAEDDAAIREYLETHFYNYEDFDNLLAGFDFKIILDTIAGDNANKTPLIDQVSSATISVSSEDFGLDENTTLDHTFYYLIARQGMGDSPTVADSTFIQYEGSLLDGSVFDARANHSWQYLPFFLRGYSQAVSLFKVGDDIVVNPDGTTSISNSGVGVMFIPSGLAYFNTSVAGVPAYSPLIFKIDSGLFVPDTDYDNDGIPSILEDVNGDGDVTNDNTDEEEEMRQRSPAFPNHLDGDDDQDGIPTRDEISDEDGNIIIPYPDSDGDGTPDYLDPDN